MISYCALKGLNSSFHTKEIQTPLQSVNKDFCSAQPQADLYTGGMSGIGDRVALRRKQLGWSVPKLAQKTGGALKYQAIQAIERGGSTRHILALAQALGVRPDWLQTGEPPMEAGKPSASQPTPQRGTADRIKVLGMAEAGPDGIALWNGEVVDTKPRPPSLEGAPDGFAVYVVGTSMEPRYHPGEVVYVHPGKPTLPGNYVLVQLGPKSDGERRALLKRLVKRSGGKVYLEQFSPAKTFAISLDEIEHTYRVVGSGDD